MKKKEIKEISADAKSSGKTQSADAKSSGKTKKENKEEVKSDSLIISPRLTEKASNLSSGNVYTFNVKNNATKLTISKEIENKYKVKPIKITVVNQPRQAVFTRGKFGFKSGFKKAYIFLKKGDKINIA